MALQDRYLPPPSALIIVVVYMAAFAGTGWALSFTPCPNCGHDFGFGRGTFDKWQLPWAPRCEHCGVKLGAPISTPQSLVE